MKLLPLLTQYLYQRKRIQIPGIGIFELDESAGTQLSEEKDADNSRFIRFQNSQVKEFDDDLINYVKEHTGKMKALAHADLSSMVNGILQFLNIGKPYYLEGIGTLYKNSNGLFDFTPGEPIPFKEELVSPTETKPASVFEKEYYSETPVGFTLRKALAVLGVLATITVVGWGGYYFYSHYQQKNRDKENLSFSPPEIDTNKEINDDAQDTTSVENRVINDTTAIIDLTAESSVSTQRNSDTFRFYLRKNASRASAFRRYEQLKGYGNDIRMETTDSIWYNLYFLIPANVNDTSRIKDSLYILFAENITIEPQRQF
ncbi:MAG TPA: hypothetical protein VIK74_10350 [Parasegetibacter sp.]